MTDFLIWLVAALGAIGGVVLERISFSPNRTGIPLQGLL
jgi:hypothetical protein